MTRDKSGSGDTRAVDQWLFRYGVTNPLESWRAAPEDKRADIAFRAIASDPALLRRIDKKLARGMTGQAEIALGDLESKATETQRAVCEVVRQRIVEWRAYMARQARSTEAIGSPDSSDAPRVDTSIPEKFRSVWKNSFIDYPQFTETTGATVATIIRDIRANGLVRVESPMDDIFGVVAARYAARCLRGVYKQRKVLREECVDIIGVVQEWAVRTNRNPLLMGYRGRLGTYAERAATLANDAMACVDLAQDLPGGPAAPGFDFWEIAAEKHCYTALMLNSGMLRHMEYGKAQAFASNAARMARHYLDNPGTYEAPDVPYEEETSPRLVYINAMSALPNGFKPRLSQAQVAEPAPSPAFAP